MRSRIVAYPPFSNANEFTQLYFRAAFYLGPLLSDIEHIRFLVVGDITPMAAPNDLDPVVATCEPNFRSKVIIQAVALADLSSDQLRDCDIVLLWDARFESMLRRLSQLNYWVVDRRSRNEGDAFIEIGWSILRARMETNSDRHRLARLVKELRTRRCYVFGTGPSLATARAHDFSDGVSIVCNSIVRNLALLKHIRPRIIVCADPIFHAGCSSYAAAFRQHLVQALELHDAVLVIQERDAHLFMAYLPAHLSDRILPIPIKYRSSVNFDFDTNGALTATKNVLTMFLLPLAFAVAGEVAVIGCDGRPVKDNDYFWAHDPASQFNAHMASIQRAHPGFFTLSYDDYYALHCETVRRWIISAERRGKTVVNLTPSHIPALASRSGPGVARTVEAASVPWQFFVHSRLAFAQRIAQAHYGALLQTLHGHPRLKQLVRTPVYWAKALADRKSSCS